MQITYRNLKIIRIAAAVFIPVIGFCGLTFLYFVNPATHIIYPCVFRLVTHLDCPGCGMTRSLYSLLHLDFWQAFRYNPMIYLVVPALAYFGVVGYIYLITGNLFKLKLKIPKPVIFSIVAVIVAFVILRNIPVEPFSYFKV